MNEQTQTKPSVFAGTGNDMAAGLDALFHQEGEFAFVRLDTIFIKETQVREVFEDEENTLDEMTADIKKRGVIQPILLREYTGSGNFDYELVAGERRCRCSIRAELKIIPAFIKKLTDEEAEEAQLVENIQRLNLTQIETAKRIQRDLDAANGDTKVVLAKYNKGASWLSKMLSLLTLPEQTKRLITESISADLEVIGKVRTIENADPAAAKALVNELAGTRRQGNAREKANAAKDKVKPSKKKPASPSPEKNPASAVADYIENSSALFPAAAAAGTGLTDKQITKHLQDAYVSAKNGKPFQYLFTNPKTRAACERSLKWFYDIGKMPQDAGRGVVAGFKQGIFAVGDYRELCLAAFSYGLNGSEFKLEFITDSVK